MSSTSIFFLYYCKMVLYVALSLCVLLSAGCLGVTPGVPCGVPVTSSGHKRIVGGHVAMNNAWPWMIYIQSGVDGSNVGSAAVIHPSVLLTSAQVLQTTSGPVKDFRDWKLYDSSYDDSVHANNRGVQLYHIDHVIIHPQYNDTNLLNDLALIVTTEEISFSNATRPVCLPDATHRYATGDVCYLAGWDDQSGSGNAGRLQQVDLPILQDSVCMKHWTDVLPETEICAGYESGHKDFCTGDIGSPLVCQDKSNSVWYIQGVASSGGDCKTADEPGLFEDILVYRNWIQSTMAAAGYTYQY
ncbi:ovochymase-1-like [Dreissena polymorpha]|uniref:Peptidase S1 domain-containing protein n=1 Tax=Dreissena polymorpha TaxID=45954 RepID=A0A9D4RKF3_DREPO|nr:ovochymase-1-like [Dreissena polymorpha]KAH3869460.1 hypothetical protein DPMN_032629 [Dreissena polymorpha]